MWEALKQIIGSPEGADEEACSDEIYRWQNRDALDAQLSEWTSQHRKEDIFERLRDARVPSSPVWKCLELVNQDPHFKARGFYEPLRHPEVGIWMVHGWLWRTSGSGPCVLAPAPDFGQHNGEILGGLLGLSDAEQDSLAQAGIIAQRPEGILDASEMPPVLSPV